MRKRSPDKPLIPNKQLELMFFRVANDEEVQKYVELAESGLPHTATAYASNKVYHLFMELVHLAEAIGALPPEGDADAAAPLTIGGEDGVSVRQRVRGQLRVLNGGSPRVQRGR